MALPKTSSLVTSTWAKRYAITTNQIVRVLRGQSYSKIQPKIVGPSDATPERTLSKRSASLSTRFS